MGSNIFFLIFLATIIITRVTLYFKPTPSPTIHGFRLHHYMYGIVFGIVGVIISNIPILAIGLGLFIDEVPYLLIGGKTHADNYSKRSLLGVAILIVAIFFLRQFIVQIFV